MPAQGGGGASVFAGLTDVDVSAKAEGTPIIYAAGTGKYTATPFSGASVARPYGASAPNLCPHGITTVLQWPTVDWDTADYQSVLDGEQPVGVAGYYLVTVYLAVFEGTGLAVYAFIDTPVDDLQPTNNAGGTLSGDYPEGASMVLSQLFQHPSTGTFAIKAENDGLADIHVYGTAQIVRLATF